MPAKLRVSAKVAGGAQHHRGVTVVAARVHHLVGFRRVQESVLLRHRQGVHVSPECPMLPSLRLPRITPTRPVLLMPVCTSSTPNALSRFRPPGRSAKFPESQVWLAWMSRRIATRSSTKADGRSLSFIVVDFFAQLWRAIVLAGGSSQAQVNCVAAPRGRSASAPSAVQTAR